ncbi:NAD-dependent epimerase/dehydratase family protein [soil metagenome]
MNLSKTLLIGGTGFLGPIILEKFPDIIAAGRSPLPNGLGNKFVHLPDLDSWSRLDAVDFDSVIFLIGSSDHKVLNSHPTLAIEMNVLPLKKMLAYLEKRPVKKLIALTTMLQYDSSKMQIPVDEGQPINPYVNNYVFSKVMAEQVTRMHRSKVPSIDVRISNVYGPTHLLRPDIVPSLMWDVLSKKTASVWNKQPKRDFIFAEDAAEAIMALCASDHVGPVNLGSGKATSVGRLTDIVSELSGVKITEQGIPVSGHMEFVQDISLLQRITGWKPKHTLEEGLSITYNRMKQHYEKFGLPKSH